MNEVSHQQKLSRPWSPFKKPFLFYSPGGCCVALHPLGGAGHKAPSPPNPCRCWIITRALFFTFHSSSWHNPEWTMKWCVPVSCAFLDRPTAPIPSGCWSTRQSLRCCPPCLQVAAVCVAALGQPTADNKVWAAKKKTKESYLYGRCMSAHGRHQGVSVQIEERKRWLSVWSLLVSLQQTTRCERARNVKEENRLCGRSKSAQSRQIGMSVQET